MPYHHLTLSSNLGYTSGLGSSVAASGSWSGTVYFVICPVYNDESVENEFTLGINPTRANAARIISGLSSNKVTLTWAAPTIKPNYYRVYYSTDISPAFDWETSEFSQQDLVISNGETSVTLNAPDPTSITNYIFGDTNPSMTLSVISNWSGEPRRNVVITAEGIHKKKSWAKNSLYSSFNIECNQLSCEAEDYIMMQMWERYATLIRIDEPIASMSDHMPIFTYILGTIAEIPTIYSWGKVNAPEWNFKFLVYEEVYN
jgi:hypothetical protein